MVIVTGEIWTQFKKKLSMYKFSITLFFCFLVFRLSEYPAFFSKSLKLIANPLQVADSVIFSLLFFDLG